VPEARCLRKNLDAMSRDEASEKYAAALSRQWMEAEPEAVGTLYVDGHVRDYHGGKTKLPRKYVSRQRLCVLGTTDYWVNDKSGRPFFAIDKVVDCGLLAALRDDLVPRLLREVPNQPTP
jgi:prepilin-type processing-associated H-X9-DG protein